MLECEGNGLDALLDDEDDDLLSSLPLDDPSASNADTSVVTQKGAVVSDPAPHASAHSVGAVPQQFAFPFEPYDIQVGFMKALYQSLDAGKIGIFESPTGTGKSLSLICGALTWLQQYEERQRTEFELLMRQQPPSATKTKGDSKGQQPSELDWIHEFSEKLSKEEETKQLRLQQEALLEKERKLEDLRNNIQPRRGKRKREKLDRDFEELLKGAPEALQAEYAASLGDQGETTEELADDSHLVVADYNSDDAADDGSQSDPEEEEHHVTKIYYCSRTHSQLSQFVKEIIKSPFGENTRVVSLGSRQNMCINEAVKKLKSLSLINDKCLDLQKNKKGGDLLVNEGKTKRRKSEGTCPFYKHEQLINYRDRILVEVNDIEQLVSLGKQGRACPYYGSRFAIPTAQVVALPYNTLLHKSTREACGIKLAGNVVIIDEAHNLLETINSIHSVEVWGAQLTQAHCQLSQYYDRYRSRLKASNLLYIKQLLFVLQGFLAALGGKPGIAAEQQKLLDQDASTKLVTINDFLFQSNLDNVNLFKVKRYCERSQISKKLNGFVEKYQPQVLPKVEVKKREEGASSGVSRFLQEIVLQQNTKDNTKRVEDVVPTTTDGQKETYGSVRSPLMHIEGFLEALTNADKDGRVVINRQNVLSRSSVKFLLLNPAVHFVNIVKEARAVVVAGGTMQPVSEFKDQLFHAVGVSPDRILEYSCGHVIPGEQLLPLALARGPTGIDLDFTFQSRNSPQLLDDAGRLMVNVCNIVPGGIVVFFPSYDYQRVVYSHWEKTGFLRKIGLKKKVFQEPRSAGQVELVLSQYTEAVRGKSCPGISGAVLFCVVGGKMSEGINFADEMGRSVIMVGLPYPNMYSPELKEKMSYLNANFPRSSDGRLPGQVHYENLCMKAVNQSIGRAIRHKNDYASILLLDQRYLRGNVVSKLPAWIAKYLLKMDRFGPAFGALSKFFIGKRTKLSNT